MPSPSSIQDLLRHQGPHRPGQGPASVISRIRAAPRAALRCSAPKVPWAASMRGAAPGTRDRSAASQQSGATGARHHAVRRQCLGPDAATGAVRWLEEQGWASTGVGRIPLVPAAVLFDVMMGDWLVRPDAAAYAACQSASTDRAAEGSVGAGTGAVVARCLAWIAP